MHNIHWARLSHSHCVWQVVGGRNKAGGARVRTGLHFRFDFCPAASCAEVRTIGRRPALANLILTPAAQKKMAKRVGLYPTQFVVGTRWDAFFRYPNLLQGMAGAKLVTYDKCGQVPPREHTGEFVKAMSEFLQ
jgi:hypothetical protein